MVIIFRNLAWLWLAELVMCSDQIENDPISCSSWKPERISLIKSLRKCGHPRIPVQGYSWASTHRKANATESIRCESAKRAARNDAL